MLFTCHIHFEHLRGLSSDYIGKDFPHEITIKKQLATVLSLDNATQIGSSSLPKWARESVVLSIVHNFQFEHLQILSSD